MGLARMQVSSLEVSSLPQAATWQPQGVRLWLVQQLQGAWKGECRSQIAPDHLPASGAGAGAGAFSLSPSAPQHGCCSEQARAVSSRASPGRGWRALPLHPNGVSWGWAGLSSHDSLAWESLAIELMLGNPHCCDRDSHLAGIPRANHHAEPCCGGWCFAHFKGLVSPSPGMQKLCESYGLGEEGAGPLGERCDTLSRKAAVLSPAGEELRPGPEAPQAQGKDVVPRPPTSVHQGDIYSSEGPCGVKLRLL